MLDTENETLMPIHSRRLVDMREYDVPYVVRVCTDLNIRAGAWYTVTPNALDNGVVSAVIKMSNSRPIPPFWPLTLNVQRHHSNFHPPTWIPFS